MPWLASGHLIGISSLSPQIRGTFQVSIRPAFSMRSMAATATRYYINHAIQVTSMPWSLQTRTIYIEIEPIRSHRPDVYIYLPLLHVRGKCCVFRDRSGNKQVAAAWGSRKWSGSWIRIENCLQPEIAGSRLVCCESLPKKRESR